MQILLNPLSCSSDKNPVTFANAGEATLIDIMVVTKIVLNLILKFRHELKYLPSSSRFLTVSILHTNIAWLMNTT